MPSQSQINLILQLKGVLNTIKTHQQQYITKGSVREFLNDYKLWNQKWFWKSSKN